MVNRDFMCIIWFGFIKWRTTKDMVEGKNVIGFIMSTMRETQDILSCGASTTALEHDCGSRTAVICCRVVSSLLTRLLSWLRYCCEKS